MSSSYAQRDPRVLDLQSRRAQAEKIWRVLAHVAHAQGISLANARGLDVGCSSGIITRALSAHIARMTGVDVDVSALRADVCAEQGGHSAAFCVATGLALPFASNSFDMVVCNQVYQYVGDVPRLLAEIRRVLRRGGFCYFSARNLWGVAAAENRVPLVAALAPRAIRLAERALKPEHDWQHRAGALWSYRRLRALAAQYFVVRDYTTRVLSDAALAELFVPPRARRVLARMPRALIAGIQPLLPTHIWILQKP